MGILGPNMSMENLQATMYTVVITYSKQKGKHEIYIIIKDKPVQVVSSYSLFVDL